MHLVEACNFVCHFVTILFSICFEHAALTVLLFATSDKSIDNMHSSVLHVQCVSDYFNCIMAYVCVCVYDCFFLLAMC